MDTAKLHDHTPKYIDNPTEADYSAAARAALAVKNFHGAIEQVSAAISLNPLHLPHLRLLDQIISAARSPLLLVALPAQGAFFGLCAVRARVLARFERVEEALDALLHATAFRPNTPFMPWAPAWVKPEKNARRVKPEALASATIMLTDAARDLSLDNGLEANLEAALAVLESVEAQHPRNIHLCVACSRVLRLLHRSDEALARLNANTDPPVWECAVERAAIHKERREMQAYCDWLKQAQKARPHEVSTYLDLGDAYLDEGRLHDAIDAYEGALVQNASADWASISAAYARALAKGEVLAWMPLFTGEPSDAIQMRANILDADLSAYTARIADPTDAVVRVIRGVRGRAANTAPGTPILLHALTDRTLAPSASTAFNFALALNARNGTLRIQPASAARELGPLWQCDRDAEPAVPRPPDNVLYRVLELVRLPFAWISWCSQATDLSSDIDGNHGTHFLHAIAHPLPPPSPDVDAVLWVHGFQIAAALLFALSPEPLDTRVERLMALAEATDDWSAGAAILGLRALAQTEPQICPALLSKLHALLPGADTPLPPYSRALAITGCELAQDETRRDFLRLRARIRIEIAAGQR